jgi:hypothetical protein
MAQHAVVVVVKKLVDGMVCHRHCDRGVGHRQSGIEKGKSRTRRHSHCRKGRRVYETLLCSSRLGRVVVVMLGGSIGGRDHTGDALERRELSWGDFALGRVTLLCYK